MKTFPVETQHLRFPPNPSNASIFKSPLQNYSQSNTLDEDLLEGLLWQWHELSDSESTVSIRFKFEMSDANRREKWLRGFRRLLELDSSKTDSIKREIEMVKQSKSYTGDLLQIFQKKQQLANRTLITFCREMQQAIELYGYGNRLIDTNFMNINL